MLSWDYAITFISKNIIIEITFSILFLGYIRTVFDLLEENV